MLREKVNKLNAQVHKLKGKVNKLRGQLHKLNPQSSRMRFKQSSASSGKRPLLRSFDRSFCACAGGDPCRQRGFPNICSGDGDTWSTLT